MERSDTGRAFKRFGRPHATRDIAAGELLIKEKPYAAIILKEEESSHCHHCFEQCSPIPCPNCIHARYCSSRCRSDSLTQYHSIECGTEQLLQQVSVFSRLSLRILITAGREELSNDIRKPKTSSSQPSSSSTSTSLTTAKGSSSGYLDGGLVNYESIVGLEAHWFNHSHEELIQYTVTSILLAKCFYRELVSLKTCETLSEEELIAEIASLLLLHTRQLKSNSHAITEVRPSEGENTAGKSAGGTVEEISQFRVATAVYPTVSMMNHACIPNIIPSFRKGILCVRATKKIMHGDEIQHCYGPQVGHMTTSDRQQALLNQYCFTCRCRACTRDPKSRDNLCMKCPKCGQPLNAMTSICGKCAVWIDVLVLLKEVDDTMITFAELVEMYPAAVKDVTLMRDVISKTKTCHDVLDRILIPPHMHLAVAYNFMAKCHIALQEFKEAAPWLAKAIPTIECRFGRDSIEVANELYKLAQIYFNGKEIAPAMEAIDRALELFIRHYGNSNEEVLVLMKMKACLMNA
eukprot:XP_011665985.1 PREDICTED: SET and MYND domain-containing protein 4 [Strongylocentrotus purpuratus]